MKKARKIDPVKEKLDTVLKYLKDTDSCDVQGPGTCRDMLIQALPHALGSGAAVDERCPFQTNLGGFIGEVLTASVAKWQGLVDDAQAALETCKKDKSEADNTLAEATIQVEKKKQDVEDSLAQSKASKEAEKEAKSALTVATKEVANFDTEQAKKEEEKTECESLLNDCFLVLKAGEYTGKFPKSKLDSVITLLTSIKTDASMLSALPLALKKKVDERGKFDEMVVSQCESIVQDHLAGLTDRVNNGVSLKAAKEADVKLSESALEAATAKKQASLDAEKTAKEICKGAEIEEKDAKKIVDVKAGAVAKAMSAYAVEESGLEKAQKVLDAFNFLKDRKAEDPVDVDEPAPPASPSRLASFSSAVSGFLGLSPKPEPTEDSEKTE